MNIATFDVEGKVARAGQASISLDDAHVAALTPEDNNQVILGFRPEALEIVDAGTHGAGGDSFPVEVDFVEELGSDAYVYGQLAGGGWNEAGARADDERETVSNQIVVRTPPLTEAKRGDVIHVQVREAGSTRLLRRRATGSSWFSSAFHVKRASGSLSRSVLR